jgi:addiction module HigA family antidote
MVKKRKPTHPGVILDEDYIKPLNLNLQMLADRLGIARNTLYKIRAGEANVTPAIALSLAEAFDTTPQLWLNLQINYDLWVEKHEHVQVKPILKNGSILRIKQNIGIARVSFA